jgi:GntR family transcriptional repressor for pyruvate dehydrogenase complex
VASQPAVTHRAVLPAMQVPKAPEVLANELRESILSGRFPAGTMLPTERDMVTQTGMSRTTVREALRILEVQGLVRVKAGRAGGAFVRQPDEDSVADSVSLLIRGRRIRITALLEAREGIEPACAQLAARYRTADDLRSLGAADAAIAAPGPLDGFLRANVAVAIASHNELLTGFMAALSRAIYQSTDNVTFVDAKVRQATVRAHARITDAIRAGDEDAALRRMTRHLHTYAAAVTEVESRTAVDVQADE